MTTLGQLAFCLPGTTACADGIDATRLGLLASRPLVADQELTTLWRQIYEPTAFLVGLADDYTPAELADAATGVDPGWLDDPSGLADDATIQAAVTALTSTRPVQINPSLGGGARDGHPVRARRLRAGPADLPQRRHGRSTLAGCRPAWTPQPFSDRPWHARSWMPRAHRRTRTTRSSATR